MVNPPAHIMTTKASGYEEPVCLQLVTNAKIANLLLDKPEGLHITELADKASLDSGKLGRILLLLATKHCFREVKPDVFANNRLSMQLVITNPVDDATFARAHGINGFGYYATPHGKTVIERASRAMVGLGEVTGKSRITKAYPSDNAPENSIICDIGGGNGHVTQEIAKNFSNIRVIVQDVPAVITQAKEYWDEEYPDAVQQQRVEFIPIDFLKNAPAPGCQFYYLRHILHDWSNANCITILTNVRKAMSLTSRLFIHEFVMQHAVRDQSTKTEVDQAPEPLLANYGMGNVRLYEQDLNMMIMLNSKERTLQGFIDLGEQTGFKYEKVWDAGTAGLIEFSVV